MSTCEITLRPIRPDDVAFLYEVYASTRMEELVPLGWPEEQVAAFLQMQFTAQHQHYQAAYSNATFDVILADGRPVGRLYVDRQPDEIRMIDIAILPQYRGAGIGSRVLANLLAEAEQAGKPVGLHVEKFNPALSWYERLGFSIVNDRGVYWFMQWIPDSALIAATRPGDPPV